MDPVRIDVGAHAALTLGLLVYLLGAALTRRSGLLRDWNIPEAVAGGLSASLALLLARVLAGVEITFDQSDRDGLLLLFFAAIGLNARLADLARGGRPLAIMLALTVAFIGVQNVIGLAGAVLFGAPAAAGPMLGSAALMGGHGTAIAWAPQIAAAGVEGAAELGVAMATIGLVAAALVGGPIARRLVEGRELEPARPEEELTIGVPFEEERREAITHVDLMQTLLALNVAVLTGLAAHEVLEAQDVMLPAFVPCLFSGIVIANLYAALLPRWPAISRTPALGLVSDYALSTFLAMSLMSLELAALASAGWMLVTVTLVQTAATVAFCLWVLFPLMGGGYRAAVLASGFGGFALGATPTAIANMTAVTKRYGPSPMAFVVLPLVSAFFVDIANSFAIRFFVSFQDVPCPTC